MRNMLQRGRIVLSWLLMGAMVLTFAGIVAPVLPQWQVLPDLLAGNLLVIAVIIVLTLLLGRIYCSVLCPLGISQTSSSGCQTAQKESPEIYFPAGTAHRAL